jgi:hypothetical protein
MQPVSSLRSAFTFINATNKYTYDATFEMVSAKISKTFLKNVVNSDKKVAVKINEKVHAMKQ